MTIARSARAWSDVFETWSRPPSDGEEGRCENAERLIREATQRDPKLIGRPIRVFAKGSYRNDTNVRRESDVDVCVVETSLYLNEYTNGVTEQEASFVVRPEYPFRQFKNEVEAALRARFGQGAVTGGDKALDVRENTYRVAADVVPSFAHRRYFRRSGELNYVEGTAFLTDRSATRIINWPDQQYRCGVAKNERTFRRYKRAVRVVKNLRNAMADAGRPSAEPIPSYLIECLVYNAPDILFGPDLYMTVRGLIIDLYAKTNDRSRALKLIEANELKWLFRPDLAPEQTWKPDQASVFLADAWAYVGFS